MKIVKIEQISLQKKKEGSQKETNSKKNVSGMRKKNNAQLITKKLELQVYDPKLIYPESRQHSTSQKHECQQFLLKSKNGTLSSYQDVVIQQISKQTRSSIKLPTISATNKTNIMRSDLKLIDIDPFVDRKDKTFQSTKVSEKKIIKNDDQDNNSQNCKLMKIQSMKPHQNKNDLSMRQVEFRKAQRSRNMQRFKIRNETQNSIIKNEIISDQKNKTQTRISQSQAKYQIPIKKQRKALSILKNNTNINGRKKYTISYLQFCLFICLMNKMNRPPNPTGSYKAHIGKGNNSILVKNTLKNRFWWNIGQNDGDINLHWTQQRDAKFLSTLKSGLNNSNIDPSKLKKKKVQFIIAPPKQNQKYDLLKGSCGIGITKLMSNQQKKNMSVTPYHVDIQLENIGSFDNPNKIKIHNHLEFNWNLTNKKALYYNMKSFYLAMKLNPFEFIPLTFHVQKEGDQEWERFVAVYNEKIQLKKQQKGKKKKQKNLWIIKPGQNSNQGCGIDVAQNLEEISEIVKNKGVRANGKSRSHIIQKYLMPFLYNKRKFDIRCYILITSVNTILKAYWYEEGYIRTSSKDFTTKNLKNRFIHLTNDAVQKKSQQYGKYQNGNKISFNDFQKYIDNTHPQKQYKFYESVYPKMMRLAADAVKSAYMLLDAKKREYSFEIMGLDFMIDDEFNTWLIQVNNNPCLELGSPLLARIIPNMIENAFKIAIDPLFPPPKQHPKSKTLLTELFQTNKFTLIFNSNQEGESLKNLLKDVNLSGIVESDQEEQGIIEQQQND